MNSLSDKYSALIQYAQTSGVQNLAVTEQNNVLYITGWAASSVKNRMFELYDQIDPDMRSGDLVMTIDVIGSEEEIYEVKAGDNLTKIAAKYSGMTWQKIFEANKDKIKDANLIYPGQKLVIPV